jgi:hypothetical protein
MPGTTSNRRQQCEKCEGLLSVLREKASSKLCGACRAPDTLPSTTVASSSGTRGRRVAMPGITDAGIKKTRTATRKSGQKIKRQVRIPLAESVLRVDGPKVGFEKEPDSNKYAAVFNGCRFVNDFSADVRDCRNTVWRVEMDYRFSVTSLVDQIREGRELRPFEFKRWDIVHTVEEDVEE